MPVGTTHHIKLGTHELIIDQGSYRKAGAPVFGPRFTTGNVDYSNLSFWQHWVQSCWVGGMGAPDWIDDAMYDAGVGVDTSTHEVALLSRDMGKGTTGWTPTGETDMRRRFALHQGVMYALNLNTAGDAKLYKYTPSTDTWAVFKTWVGKTGQSIAVFAGNIYVGLGDGSIEYWNGSAWTVIAEPTGNAGVPAAALANFRGRLYACFGRKIWRLKTDNTWDGSTVFFDAAGVTKFVDSAYHLGFLYFLSENGHVVRTDGNVTFDIWQWDGHVTGTGLVSYDGRLFVGTYEFTDSVGVGEGVIYQFSGAAVTEIKRWGRVGRATSPGRFTVAHRKLFYGASDLLGFSVDKTGFGIAVYVAAEDSHAIFASNRDNVTYPDSLGAGRSWQVDDVVYFQGYLYSSVRGHGFFKTRLQTRDVSRYVATYDTTAAGAAAHADNGGWLTSSDFDAGTPGLQKLWRRIVVHCDLPTVNQSVRVSYSLDGGETWVVAGTVSKETAATRYAKAFYLENVRSNRLKYKLQLDSTDGTRTPQVRGVVVSYLPQPEPNWQWSFTIMLADKIELLDGSEGTFDVNAITQYLENAFRAQDLLFFQDVDQSKWVMDQDGITERSGVLILDFAKDLHFIGPASDGSLEGTIRVTLQEAVESY